MAATSQARCASWTGLLRDGVERCQQVVPGLASDWAGHVHARLDSGDVITFLAVADEITRRLRTVRAGKEFADWLSNTVGALRATTSGALEAIVAIAEDRVIVTTNYDALLERSCQRRPITWQDTAEYFERVRSQTVAEVVFHIHGFVDQPESVILGSADYQRLHDDDFQAFLKNTLFASHRLLFVGTATGLSDPSVGPAIEFTEQLGDGFVLVRGSDLRAARTTPLSGAITPIAYGARHEDLVPFLQALAAGHVLEASQDPADYDAPNSGAVTIGTLDLAGPSEELVADAQETLVRVERALKQLEQRSRLVPGIESLDASTQLAIHQQVAAVLSGPAGRLLERCSVLAQQADQLEHTAGALAAKRHHSRRLVVGPLAGQIAVVASLAARSSDQAVRLSADLATRASETGDYSDSHDAVNEAGRQLREATEILESLADNLADPDRASPIS